MNIFLLFYLIELFLPRNHTFSNHQTNIIPVQQFEKELNTIQQTLKTPGLTALILQKNQVIWESAIGYKDLSNKIPMKTNTLFPLASITKTFHAILLMQLVESGKVKLTDSVSNYLPNKNVPKSIQIQHLLSHTSQGYPGEAFEYSARFGWLGDIIEKLTKKKLPEIIKEKILSPLNMDHTIPGFGARGYNHLATQIAKPYTLHKGKIQLGRYPFPGLRASTGLVSNIYDLAKYSIALDQNKLISEETKQIMWTPFRDKFQHQHPYGLGWFSLNLNQVKVHWHYGQLACYSTLLLKVPEKKLTLIVLANSNTISDHGRLFHGNPIRSALIYSFFKAFIPNCLNIKKESIDTNINYIETFERKTHYQPDELITKIMMYNFLGQSIEDAQQKAKYLMATLIEEFPELDTLADPQLFFPLLRFAKKKEFYFNEFTKRIASNLLHKYPRQPHILYMVGSFYQAIKDTKQAIFCFEKLHQLPNQDTSWFSVISAIDIAEYYSEKDSKKAKIYAYKVIHWGWNTNNALVRARQLLSQLK